MTTQKQFFSLEVEKKIIIIRVENKQVAREEAEQKKARLLVCRPLPRHYINYKFCRFLIFISQFYRNEKGFWSLLLDAILSWSLTLIGKQHNMFLIVFGFISFIILFVISCVPDLSELSCELRPSTSWGN